MSLPVNSTPPLPYPSRATSIQDLVAFDQDMVKALHRYLSELARRANDSLQKDGSEPFTGTLTFQNSSSQITIQMRGNETNPGIELGRRGASNTPYIDFHSGATDVDYDSRIIASGGSGVVGAGSLQLVSQDVALNFGRLRFPGTQNPSTDLNTLDDYEEGTWTPTLTFGGGSTGITYGANTTGHYRKVGQLVYVTGAIQLTNKGSSTGAATIGSLPFVSNSAAGSGTNGAVAVVSNMTMTGIQSISTRMGAGVSSINLRYWPGAAVDTNLTDTAFTNTTQLTFTHTYLASQ